MNGTFFLRCLLAAALVGVLGGGCVTNGAPRPGETAADARVRRLPLIERPVRDPRGDTLAVMITGDGGWGLLDRHLAHYLAGYGIPDVGLSSLKYFWVKRTPDEASRDLACILRHYFAAWHKDKAILIGYSFGADVLPYMASRLPEDLRRRVALVAILGASHEATFDFKLSDWLTGGKRGEGYPTKPEVKRLKGMKVICVYGEREKDSLCPQLDPGDAKLIKTPGSHHFDHDYKKLTDIIVRESGAI
jgi:type IV secretory pathway VirJ component